jgi:hypothetical protein
MTPPVCSKAHSQWQGNHTNISSALVNHTALLKIFNMAVEVISIDPGDMACDKEIFLFPIYSETHMFE